MSQPFIIYCPFKELNNAKETANLLLKASLIKCANILPKATSLYAWQGEIKEENEYIAIFKTTRKHLKQAEELIKENHQYEVPAILKISIAANTEFLDYLNEK
jgi:periplasmic divalent cation tolerance protein